MNRAWPLLAPFSLLYGGASALRNLMYDRGVRPSHETGVAVLSVGNLTAGGSGKSPLTQALAANLRDLAPDLPIVVVSRGYGRRTHGAQVVADGANVLLTPDLGGDEPVMIAEALGNVPVIVSERRVEGVALAVEQFGAKMIVLDDAFQHRAIGRDLDVVLLDASEPDWIWRPLPAGRLRELPQGLKRADLLVITGEASAQRKEQLVDFVRRFSEAEIVEGHAVLSHLKSHETGEQQPLEALEGKRVAAACAIARPERFFHAIEECGAEIVYRKAWRDHSWTTRDQRDTFMGRAMNAGAEVALITAKDAVKWPRSEEGLPILVPELGWKWHGDGDAMDGILARFVETAHERSILHQ